MSSAILDVKSNGKMRRMMSRKSHSWWWDSHISPKNSKWLADNLEEMDRYIKEMLKLIEEEGDSFAKKAQMYYQKRPELVSHVEGFYRMYRSLAERYDHVTGELRKNVQSDLHSQSSWSGSDFGSEPPSPSLPVFDRTPEPKPSIPKPSARAAGFEFFLGSAGSSDFSRKGSDVSSSSSSVSDSDSEEAKDVNGDDDAISLGLQQRIFELENELCIVKEKLREYEKCGKWANEKDMDLISKIVSLEDDCLAANEKLRMSKSEILNLHQKLEENNISYENAVGSDNVDNVNERETEHLKELISVKDQEIEKYKADLAEESEKFSQEKLRLEAGITNLNSLVDELKAEVKKITQQKKQVENRMSKQQNLIEQFKSNAAVSADRFSLEKSALRTEMSILSLSNSSLSAKLVQLESEKALLCSDRDRQNCDMNREIEALRLQLETLTQEKDELNARIASLNEDVKGRDGRICEMDEETSKLHTEQVKVMSELEQARRVGRELTGRVKELDEEVEKQRVLITDAAEEKREVIRQLCFSLEHYRDGYHHLIQMLLQGNSKRPRSVMAA